MLLRHANSNTHVFASEICGRSYAHGLEVWRSDVFVEPLFRNHYTKLEYAYDWYMIGIEIFKNNQKESINWQQFI
jgi:hypothetical protein